MDGSLEHKLSNNAMTVRALHFGEFQLLHMWFRQHWYGVVPFFLQRCIQTTKKERSHCKPTGA